MTTFKRLLGYFMSILILFVACSKDSNSDKEYEEPYSGYMEAKVNGVLRTWGLAKEVWPWYSDCIWGVQSGYLYSVPDTSETIQIVRDPDSSFSCEGFIAKYWISGQRSFSSMDVCENDDPLAPSTHICHEVSFNINRVGTNLYRGTFSFTASKNCGEDQVVVTDGKFEFEHEAPVCDY